MGLDDCFSKKEIIEIIFNGERIKVTKDEFYVCGILKLTHFYLLDPPFTELINCVNCNNWIIANEGMFTCRYQKEEGRFVNIRVCPKCYPDVQGFFEKSDYYKRMQREYMRLALSRNSRMNLNSNYEIDKAFFKDYEECFLTGLKSEGGFLEKTVQTDHFIALNTGHVGNTYGNLFPLAKGLNSSKANRNPFEWIKRDNVQRQIDMRKWLELINYFSYCFGLSVDEYKDFVYWCYEHPRTLEQIKKDGDKTSIELWIECK